MRQIPGSLCVCVRVCVVHIKYNCRTDALPDGQRARLN